MNQVEQLVAEWCEYHGYFVGRNIRVGKRAKGAYTGELDVAAFNPAAKHLLQVNHDRRAGLG